MIYNVSGESFNVGISSTELYGFVAWVLSSILALAFTCWAIVPDEMINKLGIYYIPDKYYLLAFANWLGVTIWIAHFTIYGFNMMMCHPLNSYFTM